MSSAFDVAAILITLAAVIGFANHRFFRLPPTVALALVGVLASLIILALDALLPSFDVGASVRKFLAGVDFHDALMQGMLSFLLFAGALHVDLSHLRRTGVQVAVLSTIGVIVSTIAIGFGFKIITSALHFDLSLAWCMVFGALISPTDPVAVMGVMKDAKTSPWLQATVSGESLFNDGVGVVVFTIMLGAAVGGGDFSLTHAGEIFAVEALGGALLGLAVGWVGYLAMRAIDEYRVELLISLAIVMGGYSLAGAIGVSGPVAMAVAGLLIGNQGVAHAMSETTRDHVIKFWSLVDEVLNAVLFLLIGLEGALLLRDVPLLLIGAAAVPLVMAARVVSVVPPLLFWRKLLPLRSSVPVLVWGGLRGGISIALALSLTAGPDKDLIVTATYIVVLFSVLVQGSTIGGAIRRTQQPEPVAFSNESG